MQQIANHCKLHAITDSLGLEAWAELDLIFWYVSLRVRFSLQGQFYAILGILFSYFQAH